MSGIAIQQFRSFVESKGVDTLINRRVTIEGQPGAQEIQAPNSLWGRIVGWVNRNQPRDNDVVAANQAARQTFYDALVKSAGGNRDFADMVLQETVGMKGDAFVQQQSALRAHVVKAVIDTADAKRDSFLRNTGKDTSNFIKHGRLADAVAYSREGLGHPNLRTDDPEVRQAFLNRVRQDPEYCLRKFNDDDFRRFALDAVKSVCEAKQARFAEQYPELKELDNGHFHDARTFFDQTRADLGKPPLNGLEHEAKQWVGDCLGRFQATTETLGKMQFDREGVAALRTEVEQSYNSLLRLKGDRENHERDRLMDTIRAGVTLGLGDEHQLPDDVKETLFSNIDRNLQQLQNQGQSLNDPEVLDFVRDGVLEDLTAYFTPVFEDAFEDAYANLVGEKLDNAIEKGRIADLGGTEGDEEQFVKSALHDMRKPLTTQLDEQIHALKASSVAEFDDGETDGMSLRHVLDREIDTQLDKLQAKHQFLEAYLQKDPLAEKNVRYNELTWARASTLAIKDAMDALVQQIEQAGFDGDDDKVTRLTGQHAILNTKHTEALQREKNIETQWRTASSERSEVSPKKAGAFQTHPFQQQRLDETRHLKSALEEANYKPPGGIDAYMKKSRIKAMETVEQWQPIERDMVVSRDGVTRSYVSKLTPGSKVSHGVGESYGKHEGISSNSKKETEHPRNLAVSELYRKERDPETGEDKNVLVSRTIRHGVLDMYKISNSAKRREVNEAGAKEVLTTAIATNEAFLQRARENDLARKQALQGPLLEGEQGPPPPLSRMVHVNLNLTTADTTLLRQISPDSRENTFTKNQFEAFEAQNGDTTFTLDGQDMDVNVDTITFSFGVNVVAMGEGVWQHVGEDERWPDDIVAHNDANMTKLIGDRTEHLAPGGHIGEIVDQLRAEAGKQETPPERRQQINTLIGKIQQETDTVRRLYNNEEYKGGVDDAYKMDRHIMKLCNLASQALEEVGNHDMMLSLSQGCKSNKDRGGMGDVEHKAQMIIDEMGGEMVPDRSLGPQDQVIYNTVLTSSGQAELQQRNTGLPGSKNAKDLADRINDPDALRYAVGFSAHTKA